MLWNGKWLGAIYYEITAPTAPSNASASILNCPSSSGMWRQGAVVMVSFRVSRAVCSVSHFHVLVGSWVSWSCCNPLRIFYINWKTLGIVVVLSCCWVLAIFECHWLWLGPFWLCLLIWLVLKILFVVFLICIFLVLNKVCWCLRWIRPDKWVYNVCQGCGKNENVINVYEVLQEFIHHGLKGGRQVSESKEHHQWFE